MSEVDKLVNRMAEELNSPNEYSLSTNPESNPSYVLINPDRTLTVPDNLRKIGIQHDHNVESVVFKCPRYNDGIDLSTMSFININWMKSNNKGGKSICTLNAVSPDDDYITFVWNVTQDVTSERGFLTVMVCMFKSDADGKEELHWNSEINKDFYIGEGLYISADDVVNTYAPGFIDQLLARMSDAEKTVNSYKIDIQELEDGSGYRVTMIDNEGEETVEIFHGHAKDKGATYTPSITEDGVLSWTNDQGLPNPDPISIKGEKGDRGETVYVPSVSEEGVLSWTNDGGLENPPEVNITGPQGIQGIQGIQGEKGNTGDRGPMGTAYQEIILTDGSADVDPFQKYRVYIPMTRKSFIDSAIDLLGDDADTWYIVACASDSDTNDIYYILQSKNNDAWPKLMKYDYEYHSSEVVWEIPGRLFDPVKSSMTVIPAHTRSEGITKQLDTLVVIWNYAECQTYNTPINWRYGEYIAVHPNLAQIGIYVDDGRVSTFPEISMFGIATYNNMSILFGGYDEDKNEYKNSICAVEESIAYGSSFVVEKWVHTTKSSIPADVYGSTTARIGDKVYLFSLRHGKVTVLDLTKFTYSYYEIEKTINIPSTITQHFQTADIPLSNVHSTIAISNKIYLLIPASGDISGKIITFDTETEEFSVVTSNNVFGSIPSGAIDASSNYGYLPTATINDKSYIIKRDENPVFFEDPGDMKDEYFYLTSEKFGSAKIHLVSQELYDNTRGYFEFEIHRMRLNDIGTSMDITYTFNDEKATFSFKPPWVDKFVTKDISYITLRFKNVTKLFRYNTNTEYGSMNGISEDIEELKTDVDTLKTDIEELKTDIETNIDTNIEQVKTDIEELKTDIDANSQALDDMNIKSSTGAYALAQKTGPGGSHGSSNTEYKGASVAKGRNATALGVLGESIGDCTLTAGYGAKALEKGCVAFGTGIAGRTSQEWIDYYWDVSNWVNKHYDNKGGVQLVEGDLPDNWQNKGIVQKPGTNEYYYVVVKSGSSWVKYAGFFLNPSYAEGQATKAKGTWSHAQGYQTEALSDFSDASGQQTKSNAHHGHAGGYSSTNNSPYGFAHGRRVETNSEVEGQVTVGKLNAKDETAQFIVGIGKDGAPKNGFSVGNDYYNPSIKVGNTILTENQLKKLLELLNQNNV